MDINNILYEIFNIIEDTDNWDNKIKRILYFIKVSIRVSHIYLLYVDNGTLYNFTRRKMKYNIKNIPKCWIHTINTGESYKKNNASLPNMNNVNMYTIPVISQYTASLCIIDSKKKINIKEYENFGQISRLLGVCFTKAQNHDQLSNLVKKNVIANISHELRTPLNSILGYTSILEYSEVNEEQFENILQIKQAGRNLLRLINDIIDISKIENSKMEFRDSPINVKDLVNESFNSSKVDQKDEVEFLYEIDDDVPDTILTDSIRLKQILINLINNAFKFTDNGSVILKISVSKNRIYSISDSSDSIERQKSLSNIVLQEDIGNMYWITFEVIDTGIGIKSNDFNKLFKTFSQLDNTEKYKGTGLGLSISYKIVQLFGGILNVESEYGVGSKFYFTIPVHEYCVNSHKIDYNLLSGANILIVDNNPENISYITSILDKYGINYHHCGNGNWALQSYINNTRFTFDMCIVDMNLEDMSYETFAKLVSKTTRNIPLIGLKNKDDHYDCDKYKFILAKPYDELDIIYSINKIIISCNKKNTIHDCKKNTFKKSIKINKRKITDNYNIQIMIVEDDIANAKMLCMMLRQMGYNNIDIANNGIEAIELIKNNKNIPYIIDKKKYCSKSIYDVILMDILMPKLDGYTATKKIKHLFSDEIYLPKIIAITANVMEGDKKRYLRIMDGYIDKPIDRDILQTTIINI